MRSSDNVESATLGSDPRGGRSAQNLLIGNGKDLKGLGDFEGKWCVAETINNIVDQNVPNAVRIIGLWISDCNHNGAPNRATLFSANYKQIGCGVRALNDKTSSTCLFATNFFSRDIPANVLFNNRVGLGPYTATVFTSPKQLSQVGVAVFDQSKYVDFQGRDPEQAKNDPQEMGDLKAQGKLRCPDYINASLQKAGGFFRKWTLTNLKCKRGEGLFKNNASNMHGYASFDFNGRCFQRNIWCSEEGQIRAQDREYITWAQAYQAFPKNNALGDAKPENKVACPQYVAPLKLEKKVVNDWYLFTDEKCTKLNTFVASVPFDKGNLCYQRTTYCSKNGLQYRKDRQYKTAAEDVN